MAAVPTPTPYLKGELEASKAPILEGARLYVNLLDAIASSLSPSCILIPARSPTSRPKLAIGLQVLGTSRSVVVDCKVVSSIKQPEEQSLPGLFDRVADQDIQALLFHT